MSTARARFRLSLVLGAGLLLLAQIGAELAPVEPAAYFGGWRLARKFEVARALGTVEVLAVGSSHADTDFDAEEFARVSGRRACNFGVGATDLYVQSVLVRDVLVPMLAPATIFWALPDTPLLDRPEAQQYRDAPFLSRARLPQGYRIVALESRLAYQRKRRLRDWIADLADPPGAVVDRFGQTRLHHQIELGPREGATAAGLSADAEDAGAIELSEAEREARIEETYRVFAQALDSARAHGVRVVGLLTPYHASAFEPGAAYRTKMLSGRFEVFRARSVRTLREHGATFVNWRWLTGISEQDGLFADYQHLNADGARALVPFLVRAADGRDLPDEWSRLATSDERRLLAPR